MNLQIYMTGKYVIIYIQSFIYWHISVAFNDTTCVRDNAKQKELHISKLISLSSFVFKPMQTWQIVFFSFLTWLPRLHPCSLRKSPPQCFPLIKLKLTVFKTVSCWNPEIFLWTHIQGKPTINRELSPPMKQRLVSKLAH